MNPLIQLFVFVTMVFAWALAIFLYGPALIAYAAVALAAIY